MWWGQGLRGEAHTTLTTPNRTSHDPSWEKRTRKAPELGPGKTGGGHPGLQAEAALSRPPPQSRGVAAHPEVNHEALEACCSATQPHSACPPWHLQPSLPGEVLRTVNSVSSALNAAYQRRTVSILKAPLRSPHKNPPWGPSCHPCFDPSIHARLLPAYDWASRTEASCSNYTSTC